MAADNADDLLPKVLESQLETATIAARMCRVAMGKQELVTLLVNSLIEASITAVSIEVLANDASYKIDQAIRQRLRGIAADVTF